MGLWHIHTPALHEVQRRRPHPHTHTHTHTHILDVNSIALPNPGHANGVTAPDATAVNISNKRWPPNKYPPGVSTHDPSNEVLVATAAA
jgi:hypothetical protein